MVLGRETTLTGLQGGGYLSACTFAGFALSVIGLINQLSGGGFDDGLVVGTLLFFFGVLVMAAFAFVIALPGLVALLAWTRFVGVPSIALYAVFGTVGGGWPWLISALLGQSGAATEWALFALIGALAGILAGWLVWYWMKQDRRDGRFRERIRNN